MGNDSEESKEDVSEVEESESEREEVFYETNASELSDKDKNYRRIRAVGLILFYLIIAFALFLFLDVLAMIVVFVIMWFSPYPFIPTFAIYKITDRAVVDDKGRRLEITPEYRFVINEKHGYVGLKKGRRFVLWLYTKEPERVTKFLERVSRISYDRLLKEKGSKAEEKSK
ncbi:MAG: DUF2208 family protein [Candidatus Methanomethylicia archaeon]